MYIRILKLTTILFLLMTPFVFHQNNVSSQPFNIKENKKCKGRKEPEAVIKKGYTECKDRQIQSCTSNKPDYKLVKAEGCEKFTETGVTWYCYIYTRIKPVEYGTVDCQWISLKGGYCQNDESTWSKKKSNLNECYDFKTDF